MKWSPHMPWKCRARLARHREFHGLLNPELEQRFARDLQLLTLLGRSNCSSTNGPDERANSRTFPSPCNTPDERAQPCTAYHFTRCLLALALALDLVRAGEQRISRAINNDVCQFKRELGASRHLARGRCLYQTAVHRTSSGRHNYVFRLEIGFQACRETVTRLLFVGVYGVDHPDEDSHSCRDGDLLFTLRRRVCGRRRECCGHCCPSPLARIRTCKRHRPHQSRYP